VNRLLRDTLDQHDAFPAGASATGCAASALYCVGIDRLPNGVSKQSLAKSSKLALPLKVIDGPNSGLGTPSAIGRG
jgi:hypothetical protein